MEAGPSEEAAEFLQRRGWGCSVRRSGQRVWLNLHVFLIWDVFVDGDGSKVLGRDLNI